MVGLLVEEITKLRVWRVFARTKNAIDVENLLRMCKAKADISVVEHIHQEIRLKWIDCRRHVLLGATGNYLSVFVPEAKDDAGCDDLVRGVARHYRIESERRLFKDRAVGLYVFQ